MDPFFSDFLTVVYYPESVIIGLHDYAIIDVHTLTLIKYALFLTLFMI